MKRKTCLICGSNKLNKILDLGYHAYADSFIPKERKYDCLKVYNLSCALCEDCGQVQTISKTDPKERYSLYDYSYTSSNSKVSREHWKKYADTICKKFSLGENSLVVEVGSNDGCLLKYFKSHNQRVIGVDASEYIAELAEKSGIKTIVGLFDYNLSQDIVRKHSNADLVVANNVFNHSEDPISFTKGISNLLKKDGYFVFELPYWKNSIDSQKIDQVYHEHVSYFTAKSSKKIMETCGFKIIDIEVVDYHGGSLRVYAQKTKNTNIEHCDKLYEFIKNEAPLFDLVTYKDLIKQLLQRKNNLNKKLIEIKSKNIPIVAIGAAAKGNTSLTYLSLDNTIIDYVTDTSVHKKNKLTPLTGIPIVDDNILASYEEVYALILCWNLSDVVKQKLKTINNKIKFLEW